MPPHDCGSRRIEPVPAIVGRGPGGGGFPRDGFGSGGAFSSVGGPGGFSNSGSLHGPSPANVPDSAGTVSTVRGGLQLGPPGRWWDDKHFAKTLKLRPEQQRHMDTTFEGNRANLLRQYQSLQQEELRMEALTKARVLDEAALDGQIDRVAQARAELEKANTHYLLQIRAEMNAEQVSRLEQHR